jgi:hypothetical protein
MRFTGSRRPVCPARDSAVLTGPVSLWAISRSCEWDFPDAAPPLAADFADGALQSHEEKGFITVRQAGDGGKKMQN